MVDMGPSSEIIEWWRSHENILSTYFVSDCCQVPLPIFIKYERHAFIYYQVRLLSDDGLWKYFTTYFANFHKIWTKCFHFYQLFWLFHFFMKYERRGLNWLYQLLWMARKWFEHFDGKMDFHFILLKQEIIEWRLLQIFHRTG